MSSSTRQRFKVVAPVDLPSATSIFDLMLKSDHMLLVYPQEQKSISQPKVYNFSKMQLTPTKPNLLEEFNKGLLFPAFCPGHNVYATHLTNATCLPSGIILTHDRRIFSESFRTPKSFLDPDPFVSRPGLHYSSDSGDFDLVEFSSDKTLSFIDETCFFLDGLHFGSFGHMIGEILTRLWYFTFSGDDVSRFKFICGHGSASTFLPYVRAFGITEENLIFNRSGLICKRLLVASQGMIVRQSVSTAARSVWTQLRREMDAGSNLKKVYLSRSKISSRNLSNELEVENLFSQFGFHVIHPQDHTLSEQISLMSHATHVAGPSGSNWFNIAFARRRQAHLMLTSANYILHSEKLMEIEGENSLTYAVFKPIDGKDVHGRWSVNLDELRAVVESWVQE